MENSPRDCGPGGQWLCFIFIWWGIVLEPCGHTLNASQFVIYIIHEISKKKKNFQIQVKAYPCI